MEGNHCLRPNVHTIHPKFYVILVILDCVIMRRPARESEANVERERESECVREKRERERESAREILYSYVKRVQRTSVARVGVFPLTIGLF